MINNQRGQADAFGTDGSVERETASRDAEVFQGFARVMDTSPVVVRAAM
jgi:hypothetical protein